MIWLKYKEGKWFLKQGNFVVIFPMANYLNIQTFYFCKLCGNETRLIAEN